MILKGGDVLDPLRRTRTKEDIALAGDRIAARSASLPAESARQVLDTSGMLVTPGLIDLHGHFYSGGFFAAADVDQVCLPNGVTTAVDAGSSGANTYAGLATIANSSRVRLLAFLHVAAAGLSVRPQVGELLDLGAMDPEATRRIAREDPRVRGIKIRILGPALGDSDAAEALARALAIAESAGLPLMVHVFGSPLPLADVFRTLRGGDIVTHVFHAEGETILDGRGRVLSEVWDAVKRGVALDIGHGAVAFDIAVAQAAISEGLLPTTLSTDAVSIEDGLPRYSVADILAEVVALGMPLMDAFAAVTVAPAKLLGLGTAIGNVEIGASADVGVFELQERPIRFRDCTGRTLRGDLRLRPRYVVRAGQVWPSPERSPWTFTQPDSDLAPGLAQ